MGIVQRATPPEDTASVAEALELSATAPNPPGPAKMPSAAEAAEAEELDFAELLRRLGWQPGELMQLGFRAADGGYVPRVVEPTALAKADGVFADIPQDVDLWFGINPVRADWRSRRRRGKGKGGGRPNRTDIARVVTLCADIDVKPGGCADEATAWAVVERISARLGTRPVAVTRSGGGLQAFWGIAGAVVGEDFPVWAVAALLRRFGVLARQEAKMLGVKLDGVFESARVMRVPGSRNHKPEHATADGPPLVVCLAGGGRALTLVELDAVLPASAVGSAAGKTVDGAEEPADEADLDDEAHETYVPLDFVWREKSCGYARRLLEELAADFPESNRHPWMVSRFIRLACLGVAGCLSESDWLDAIAALRAELIARRELTDVGEIGRLVKYAKGEARSQSEAGLADEIDYPHGHHDGGSGGIGGVGGDWSAGDAAAYVTELTGVGDPTLADMLAALGEAGFLDSEVGGGGDGAGDAIPAAVEVLEPPPGIAPGDWMGSAGWSRSGVARDLPEPRPLVKFWETGPELRAIRDWARARRVSPWGLFGTVLLRVLYLIPPRVVLPPLVGGVGSLNLFVAVVGTSGQGKDTSASASEDGFPMPPRPDLWFGDPDDEWPFAIQPGSGEGIAHLYARRVPLPGRAKGSTETVVEQYRSAALLTVGEVETMVALGARSGSTLMGIVRDLYNAARLGHAFVDPEKRLPLAGHSYRAGIWLGVQPANAGGLLLGREATGGTPQRLLWLPGDDPYAPEIRPPDPDPFPIPAPFLDGRYLPVGGGRHVLDVPPVVVEEIDAARLGILRKVPGLDPLAGHKLFTRLKVAAGLMALAGRAVMKVEDWELAGAVMQMSDATRGEVTAALDGVGAGADEERALSEVRRAVARERLIDRLFIGRLVKYVAKAGASGISGSDLVRKCKSTEREAARRVLEAMVEDEMLILSGSRYFVGPK